MAASETLLIDLLRCVCPINLDLELAIGRMASSGTPPVLAATLANRHAILMTVRVVAKSMLSLLLTLNMGDFGPSSADSHICTGKAWADPFVISGILLLVTCSSCSMQSGELRRPILLYHPQEHVN